jgi:type IV pilus assembly protein PilC
MTAFTYTARALNGDLRTATIEAPNRDEVVAQLRRQRLNVVKIDEAAVAKRKKPGKISMRDIVIFTRQFSTMINAGLPLVQALDILAKQSENQALKDVTRAVVYDVESGHTVADALRKHPNAFSDLYVNMVAAGEAGGILDTILMRLATFMEKNDALVRKVKGAMIYPAVITSVAAIAIIVLLLFVIPVFEKMFASVGMALPLPTRVVIAMSKFLTGYWWAVLASITGFVISIKKYYKTNDGKLAIDKLALKMPVLGDVLRKSAVSRFGRVDPRRPRDHGEDRRQSRHLRRDHGVPHLDRRR